MSNDLAIVLAVAVFFGTLTLWDKMEKQGDHRGRLIFIGVNATIFVLLIARYVS